jgi:glycosyltransferase involved in cell wall biosynthesis
MLKEKGIEEFVGAARLLRKQGFIAEFHLLGFLGDGEGAITRSQMDEWEREGSIRYLGETDKVEEFMACADCVVLPSYYREGVPRVLLEAAGLGKPIIASDNVGCREVVMDGVNGFLCRSRDVEDLAEKMQAFLTLDSRSREVMGSKAREKAVLEFDERIVIDKYLAAIGDVSKAS